MSMQLLNLVQLILAVAFGASMPNWERLQLMDLSRGIRQHIKSLSPNSKEFQLMKEIEEKATRHALSRNATPGALHEIIEGLNGYCRESIGCTCAANAGEIQGCCFVLELILNRHSF